MIERIAWKVMRVAVIVVVSLTVATFGYALYRAVTQ